MADFPIGAHLKSARVLYKHHGIYIGHQQVVHYSGWNQFGQNHGKIECVSLQEFQNQGGTIQVVPHAHPQFSPEEIVQRALSKMGETKYHILFNNCEHFAHWCINGNHSSSQVKHATTVAVLITALVGAAVKVHKDKNRT